MAQTTAQRPYTLDEALNILPTVGEQLQRLARIRTDLAGKGDRLQTILFQRESEGRNFSGAADLRRIRSDIDALLDEFNEVKRALADLGCELAGKEQATAHLVARLGTAEFLLCWRPEDGSKVCWHSRDASCETRMPLEGSQEVFGVGAGSASANPNR